MKFPVALETERLLMRSPLLTDAPAIYDAYASDPKVARFVTWRPHENVRQTEDYVESCIIGWESGQRFAYLLFSKDQNVLIGMTEIRVPAFKADVGYVLARQFWGRGFAAESLLPLIEHTLSDERIFRVGAVCDVENVGSARVLEKVGMQREGVLRRYVLHPNISNEPRDCFCYARIK